MGSDSGSKPGLRLLAFHISLSANTIVQPRPAWRKAKPMVGEQWGGARLVVCKVVVAQKTGRWVFGRDERGCCDQPTLCGISNREEKWIRLLPPFVACFGCTSFIQVGNRNWVNIEGCA